jgi:mRNA interferase RelE/StbE
MAWKIELDPLAEKELNKLDKQLAKRLLSFLFNRLAVLDDVRSLGAALQRSKLGGFWKYRVGDYRIIVLILDKEVKILVIKIGNRKEVYR